MAIGLEKSKKKSNSYLKGSKEQSDENTNKKIIRPWETFDRFKKEYRIEQTETDSIFSLPNENPKSAQQNVIEYFLTSQSKTKNNNKIKAGGFFSFIKCLITFKF